MAPSRKKVEAAVSAMEKLGIGRSVTRPVLIKLLKKHKNRWKPIEEASYQLLADSIFEMQEEKERRAAANGTALVAEMKSRGRGRKKRTELGQSSHLVPNQLVPVNDSEVHVPLLCAPESLAAGREDFSASDKREGQYYRRRRSWKLMAPLAVCANVRSSDHVDAGVESCNNKKTESGVVPARTRKVNPEDIANGEEMLTISVASDVCIEVPYFKYIPENVVYKSADVRVSIVGIGDNGCCKGCYGDCLDSLSFCSCRERNGGEYAYTSEGLVRDNILNACIFGKRNPQSYLYFCNSCPIERERGEKKQGSCKGHLRRLFIKECWDVCVCDAYCRNRVVQRRMYPKMEVFYSGKKKGWGVRTLEELPRGAFVCEYVGEVLTCKEYYERTTNAIANGKQKYAIVLDANWASKTFLKDEEALCLDATSYGNVARFINHRCYDANLVDIPVEIETPEHHYYHVAFFAARNINMDEELNWDYGFDVIGKSLTMKAFKCYCGSRHCRGKNNDSPGVPSSTT